VTAGAWPPAKRLARNLAFFALEGSSQKTEWTRPPPRKAGPPERRHRLGRGVFTALSESANNTSTLSGRPAGPAFRNGRGLLGVHGAQRLVRSNRHQRLELWPQARRPSFPTGTIRMQKIPVRLKARPLTIRQ
jgi:hypothetical protein